MRNFWATLLALQLFAGCPFVATDEESAEKVHQTEPAKKPKNNLRCYACDTMTEGERCSNLNIGNRSTLVKKCENEDLTCMVKRFSYTTGTENMTSIMRMWSLSRNCTAKCEPGCIVIGERTKLYACTSCCNATLCNTGKAASPPPAGLSTVLHLLATIVTSISLMDIVASPR